ncbi:hypothetical protein CQW23_24586 [Capsicum baccatum]|uniref:RWP-RK domain-containing protein n=1 Tax=Capsicum baccatum TaxID=33114 RepID=A0A2G2VV87_CAPBA|nr:hypothetical protein CQW23_24586 [Capsicum baccatum]
MERALHDPFRRRRRLVLAKRRRGHLRKMDNPTAIVPYHDPFDDDSSLVQISLFDDENPIIDGPWDNEPFSLFHENPPILISDIGVSNTDPILLQCSNYLVGNSTTNTEGGVPGTNYCSTSHNCQILREITHSDGLQISKLDIYGTLGKISHAVLEKYTMDFSSQTHKSSQIFDFSNDSTNSVKQFLVHYFEACKSEGYIVLLDPLCNFYEALGVGSDGGDCFDIDSLLQLSPTTSRDFKMDQQEKRNESEYNNSDVRHEKISLSAQRERTGKLRLKDFAGYLHLPIEIAAKKLNICPTVMKKVCRRDGLSRWPYRKINSIQRKISLREKCLSSNHVEERASAKAAIAKLEQELDNIFEAFSN